MNVNQQTLNAMLFIPAEQPIVVLLLVVVVGVAAVGQHPGTVMPSTVVNRWLAVNLLLTQIARNNVLLSPVVLQLAVPVAVVVNVVPVPVIYLMVRVI